MDADDESLPDRFNFQIGFMEKNQDIDVLGTAIFRVANNKKKRRMKAPALHEQCLNRLVVVVGPCCYSSCGNDKKNSNK